MNICVLVDHRMMKKMFLQALKPKEEDKGIKQSDQREDRGDADKAKLRLPSSEKKESKEGQIAGNVGIGNTRTDGGSLRGKVQPARVDSLEKKFTIRRHDDDQRKSRTFNPHTSTTRGDRERDRSADRIRPQFSIRRGLPRSHPGERPRPFSQDRRDDRERFYDRNRDDGRDRFGDREGSKRLRQDRRPMYDSRDGYERGTPSRRFRRENSPR